MNAVAAAICLDALDGDLAAAGCRIAIHQLRVDWGNPDLTADQRRHRFDQVAAVTRDQLDEQPRQAD